MSEKKKWQIDKFKYKKKKKTDTCEKLAVVPDLKKNHCNHEFLNIVMYL